MDIDDRENKSAREVKRIFDISVAEVGEMHKWNCLMRRAVAALQQTKPPFGYENQFKLPSDFLRLVTLNGNEADEERDLWDVEGNMLLSDTDIAEIRYVAHIRDTTIYRPGFVMGLQHWIAAKVATPIRQDTAKADSLRNEFFERILPLAKTTDGNERKRKTYDQTRGSQFIRSRRVSTKG